MKRSAQTPVPVMPPAAAGPARRRVAVLLQLYQNYDQGILRGISAYARECGNWSLYVEEEQYHWLPDFREWNGDGYIVNYDHPVLARAVRRLDKPVVGLGGGGGWYDSASGIPYVTTDNAAIGRLAAEHLLDCGLKHFAFCGYPPTRTNVWLVGRQRAFMTRLAEAGFGCTVFCGRYATGRHWNRMQRELQAWLRTLPKPIGIMGCYDWRARHVLEACHALGLRVPDDIALIGVDNDLILCELTDPPLSSIEQGRFGIGYTAAAALDRLMSGHRPERSFYCIPPVGLVSRQSTNLLAVDDATVATALRLIRDSANRDMQVDTVARQVGCSRVTLDNRFKKAIGRTADTEIRRVRLASALELLVRTDLPLSEVARKAGFADQQYLSVVVRKATSRTPMQYRREHQLQRALHVAQLP